MNEILGKLERDGFLRIVSSAPDYSTCTSCGFDLDAEGVLDDETPHHPDCLNGWHPGAHAFEIRGSRGQLLSVASKISGALAWGRTWTKRGYRTTCTDTRDGTILWKDK